MVFHSTEHIASVFIHIAPMYTSWCLRWHHEAFREAWPLYANLSRSIEAAEATATFGDLFWPTFYVYLVWWIPYTLWLLCHGIHLPDRGIDTGYSYFARSKLFVKFGVGKLVNKATCGIVSVENKYGGLMSYLIFHFLGIFLPSISICWIFFCSYWANLTLCIVSVGLATYRGAKYYNYLMIEAFEKILEDAEKQHNEMVESASDAKK